MRLSLVLVLMVFPLWALTPSAEVVAHDVKVLGGFFDPPSLAVAPGDKVNFTNEDSAAHTVTSTWDGGATFDRVLLAGESFTLSFPEAGPWKVHCRPHSGMTMAILADASAAVVRVPGATLLLVIGAAVGAALLLSPRR